MAPGDRLIDLGDYVHQVDTPRPDNQFTPEFYTWFETQHGLPEGSVPYVYKRFFAEHEPGADERALTAILSARPQQGPGGTIIWPPQRSPKLKTGLIDRFKEHKENSAKAADREEAGVYKSKREKGLQRTPAVHQRHPQQGTQGVAGVSGVHYTGALHQCHPQQGTQGVAGVSGVTRTNAIHRRPVPPAAPARAHVAGRGSLSRPKASLSPKKEASYVSQNGAVKKMTSPKKMASPTFSEKKRHRDLAAQRLEGRDSHGRLDGPPDWESMGRLWGQDERGNTVRQSARNRPTFSPLISPDSNNSLSPPLDAAAPHRRWKGKGRG